MSAPSHQDLPSLELRRSSKNLSKAVFSADVPEQYIRTVPAQSLFLAVKAAGLSSSMDLIGIATPEQIRLMLDFDCWQGDRFNEDHFWEWLSLTEEGGDLAILQRVLKSTDLRLVSLITSKYVHVLTFDEPTENPPSAGYYTPDKGYTWIHLNIPDSDRHFLLGRLLALIFETSAELFYQIINIPGVATESSLEEESYQERNKRIWSEGVPDPELAHQLHAPIDEQEIAKSLKTKGTPEKPKEIFVIEPFVYEGHKLEPLHSLISSGREGVEEELSLIANAAIVRFGIEFGSIEQVLHLASKVRGALNVGLEKAQALRPNASAQEIYDSLGLQKIYRLGVTALYDLRRTATALSKKKLEAELADDESRAILAGAMELLPEAPRFFERDGSITSSSGKLAPGFRAIEHADELDVLKKRVAALS